MDRETETYERIMRMETGMNAMSNQLVRLETNFANISSKVNGAYRIFGWMLTVFGAVLITGAANFIVHGGLAATAVMGVAP